MFNNGENIFFLEEITVFLLCTEAVSFDNTYSLIYDKINNNFTINNNFFSLKVPGSYEGNEDCLNLNVFTKVTNSTSLKPVMFWIHGGDFLYGSAPPYDPTSLVKEDVIVVSINYRLGALGFLNFGNDLAPGNLGIRDQIQALRWVKMMIWYFGGDPNRITIFGESAGGMSCHAITMSPKAYGLISGMC